MRDECTSFAEKLTGLFSDIIIRTMTVQLLRELDDADITLSQLQALTHVAERGTCPVGSIAEGLRVTHPAAVKLVDKLMKKGLVTRAVGATDHRRSDIKITVQGRELVNDIRRERNQRLERVLDRMPVQDRGALIHGLQSFVTAALKDESTLDGLCASCQALYPTDCEEYQQISGERLLAARARLDVGARVTDGARDRAQEELVEADIKWQ